MIDHLARRQTAQRNEIKDDADKLFIQNLNGHAYIMKLL
jgi:hypothetical protein